MEVSSPEEYQTGSVPWSGQRPRLSSIKIWIASGFLTDFGNDSPLAEPRPNFLGLT